MTTGPLVVFVTGASSGIGRASALRFARQGARLILVSRSREALAEVEAECISSGAGGTLVAVADVARQEQLEAALAPAVDAYSGVDLCVDAAAVAAYDGWTECPPRSSTGSSTPASRAPRNVARVVLAHFRERDKGTPEPARLGPRADHHAVHIAVRREQVGGSRVRAHDEAGGEGPAARARLRGVAGRGQHAGVPAERELRGPGGAAAPTGGGVPGAGRGHHRPGGPASSCPHRGRLGEPDHDVRLHRAARPVRRARRPPDEAARSRPGAGAARPRQCPRPPAGHGEHPRAVAGPAGLRR